jgi:hypothetical protein
MLVRAYTSGVTPVFVSSMTLSGKVLLPGPVVKKLMIISSIDKVNAKNAPDITPGMIIGKVTVKKVLNLFAPRSMAASSTDLSKPANLAFTVNTTKGMLKVACAMIKETNPIGTLEILKIASKEIPSTISGMTTGI